MGVILISIAMIEVAGVRKVYGDTVAVADLSFRLNAGEAVGLLGLNGAGKTTTLSMLATVLTPSVGSISIGGYTVPKNLKEARKQIGFMPDTPPLYPDMRVREYLLHITKLRGVKRQGRSLAVDSALERCKLESVQYVLCGHLSRGYRQRVSLAQALIHDPAVLLLDEPTSGLDPEQTHELRTLLRSIASKKTLLFSSHILSEVQAVCSRVLLMHRDKLQRAFTIDELAADETLESKFFDSLSELSQSAGRGV